MWCSKICVETILLTKHFIFQQWMPVYILSLATMVTNKYVRKEQLSLKCCHVSDHYNYVLANDYKGIG